MEEKTDAVQEAASAVSDDWEPFEGLPEYSAEFENGKFALAIHQTNNLELTLHHPSGVTTGTDGYRKEDVIANINCSGTQAAKQVVQAFSNHPEEFLNDDLDDE